MSRLVRWLVLAELLAPLLLTIAVLIARAAS